MKHAALFLAASLAFGALAATARADDAQAQIQAAYDAQCKAALARDAAAFQKTFDPKFVATDFEGKKQALAEVVAGVITVQPGITFSTCSFAIRKLVPGKDGTTAEVTQTVTGTFAQSGSPQPFTQIDESTDVWSPGASPLQLSSAETGRKLTIGGKVVDEKGTLASPASPVPSATPGR